MGLIIKKVSVKKAVFRYVKLHHNEIEYKYDASGITPQAFAKLMRQVKRDHRRLKKVTASSFDHYYTNATGEFIRFRDSKTKPELTTKKKLSDKNNWNRIEVNLDLKPGKGLKESVDAFCKAIGFKRNFSIFKSCHMYFVKDLNFVYYVVQNQKNKKLGTFIEIEYCEKKVKGKTAKQVFKTLNEFEIYLNQIGITKTERLDQSLFEMFRRTA